MVSRIPAIFILLALLAEYWGVCVTFWMALPALVAACLAVADPDFRRLESDSLEISMIRPTGHRPVQKKIPVMIQKPRSIPELSFLLRELVLLRDLVVVLRERVVVLPVALLMVVVFPVALLPLLLSPAVVFPVLSTAASPAAAAEKPPVWTSTFFSPPSLE